MTGKQIQDLINRNRKNVYLANKRADYALGENTEIYRDNPRPDPDNRIPVPIARRGVMLVKGYMAKPGQITYYGDIYEEVKEAYDYNDEQLLTSEILENALIHGISYEIHWNEDGLSEFALCPQDQAIPIWNKSLKPKLDAFIRHYKNELDEEIAIYWDDVEVVTFRKANNSDYFKEESRQPHGFGRVPINHYTIDAKQRNLFDHVIPLIDEYDKIISQDIANELERYANSYLALAFQIDDTTQDDDGKTDVDKLKESKLFQNVPGKISDAIQYITKPAVDEFINIASDRIERLIYEGMMLFNPNDDTFNAASGVAAAYKMLAFEYLCASVEAYFMAGLYRRPEFILAGRGIQAENDMSIKFTRNLPSNLLEIAQIASLLKGTLDDETILRLFPGDVVADPSEVMQKLEEAGVARLFGDNASGS